jgi:hypothetical protein
MARVAAAEKVSSSVAMGAAAALTQPRLTQALAGL